MLLLPVAAAEAPAATALRVERLADLPGEDRAEAVLLRLDPERCRVRVLRAETPTTAREVAREPRVLAALNGGYFDADARPLGLVVSDGILLSPVARRGWGTFVIRSGRASVHPAATTPRSVDQGLQAGPRLVVAGRAATLRSAARARRSFAGIDGAGRVVLGCAQAPVTLQRLAQLLARSEAEGGAGLVDALNLDGGSSTQLFLRPSPACEPLFVPGVPVPTFLVVEEAATSSP